ncbi:hypothetical protein VPH35_038558 [Triticum aestivum]
MTNTMLGFLADLVAKGKRTSSGFRKTHLKQCATVLNEQFKLAITSDQVRNHLKKWRKIWVRVTHKPDAPFLNNPIEHYHAMETIFGTTGAKGMNARSGNNLLSIDVDDEENGEVNGEINTSPQVGESAHPKGPPKKKAKVVKVLEDPLGAILKDGFKLVAEALVKSGGDDDDIPDDLWDVVSNLKEFDEEHLAHYYAHLVDNPKTARAFMKLSETNKSVWVSRYVKKNF